MHGLCTAEKGGVRVNLLIVATYGSDILCVPMTFVWARTAEIQHRLSPVFAFNAECDDLRSVNFV